MQRVKPEKQQHAAGLERWESWPLWALGLSNGLNIALWYVLSMARIDAPELPILVLVELVSVLPLIVAIGGIAAAVSLDGVLIASIAGARHGRRGIWTWLTIVGACGFSAAIAYAVHAGQLDQAPGLHVAQAVVLALYNLHLSQPRKTLHSDEKIDPHLQEGSNGQKTPDRLLTAVTGFTCKRCGQSGFETLRDVRIHQGETCVSVIQQELDAPLQNGRREV